jgi:hypothetical protein
MFKTKQRKIVSNLKVTIEDEGNMEEQSTNFLHSILGTLCYMLIKYVITLDLIFLQSGDY